MRSLIDVKVFLPFLCKYFKNAYLWTILAPFPREIEICVHWVFFEEILFWATFVRSLFRYKRYFLLRSALKGTFSFQCIIIFQNRKFLEPPSSTLGVARHPSSDIFSGNLILRNFCSSSFRCNRYFLQCSVLKETCFPNPVYYFKNDNSWSPLVPLLGYIEICVQWDFCRKFNSTQLLFQAFFDIIGIFMRNFILKFARFFSLHNSKSTKNKGLISNGKKSVQNLYTGKISV